MSHPPPSSKPPKIPKLKSLMYKPTDDKPKTPAATPTIQQSSQVLAASLMYLSKDEKPKAPPAAPKPQQSSQTPAASSAPPQAASTPTCPPEPQTAPTTPPPPLQVPPTHSWTNWGLMQHSTYTTQYTGYPPSFGTLVNPPTPQNQETTIQAAMVNFEFGRRHPPARVHGLPTKAEFLACHVYVAKPDDKYNDDKCPFCWDSYHEGHPAMRIDPCAHVFGKPCLEQLTQTSTLCPKCRVPLFRRLGRRGSCGRNELHMDS
ncbi:hypothetical protein BU23DRAFT_601664 [Bimuria novae-zelandiae CBS 107.79]|uniref:RING-type domain-containing protein n=1 Tax=Bimuria novae-zelandiae CBS 107.79 TaxID=1447943 RepID=A0A6A5UY14_9PLEO|nr:hypothetical protein BU23DRAFT_601664 [Bimuria novae-zelandiae CBS 107.79]